MMEESHNAGQSDMESLSLQVKLREGGGVGLDGYEVTSSVSSAAFVYRWRSVRKPNLR